jgi:hypothetical protein
MIPTPIKPFPSYKWRWLSVAPTESLLDPPVFLGALRVFARNDGARNSDPAVAEQLAIVQRETKTPVNLVRTPERNLIRNSGQYWKGTGLLTPASGRIEVTALGLRVANGDVTQSEFAAIMVQQTILANPLTYPPSEVEEWRRAGLEIKPLELILSVLEDLGKRARSVKEACITPAELVRICIPLAGAKATSKTMAKAIMEYRSGVLDVSGWPDCAPASNDHRLAREFLLFLGNFGLCRRAGQTAADERFCLDELYDVNAVLTEHRASLFDQPTSTNTIIEEIRHSALPSIIDRQRIMSAVLSRPGQSRFRQNILQAFNGRCIITGDSIDNILEAAHIIPVANGGSDGPENGLCLRVDIHRLFDSGNIRLRQDGQIHLSNPIRESPNYGFLPERIALPQFINPVNVHWRDTYL